MLGFGLAANVAPLTATALSAAPAEHSGIASAVNNDVARTASLIAVAVLPALAGSTGEVYLHPAPLTHGFHIAMLIAAAAVGGVLAALTVRNGPRPEHYGLGIYSVQLSCGTAWGHDGGWPGGFKTIAYTSRDGSRQAVMVYNNFLICENPTPSFQRDETRAMEIAFCGR